MARKMIKWISLAIAGVALMVLFAQAISFVVKLRRPTTSGTCPTITCLQKIPQLSPIMPYLPDDIHDISYFQAGDYYQISFTIDEPRFQKWAIERGCNRNGMQRLDHNFDLPLEGESGPVAIAAQDGYHCVRQSLDGSVDVGEIAYCVSTKRAYLISWLSAEKRGQTVGEFQSK